MHENQSSQNNLADIHHHYNTAGAVCTDLGNIFIKDKLEDLNGLTVEIIANVSFDEYNEENRLSPKKILNKYF